MSKIIYNLGDPTPINGSAFLVYDDYTCVAWDRNHFEEEILVHKFVLSPTVIEDYDWLSIDKLSEETDATKEQLLSLTSGDLYSLAQFYWYLHLIYGFEKFSDSEYINISDLQKTYAKQIKRIAVIPSTPPTNKEAIDSFKDNFVNDIYKVFEEDKEVTKEELAMEIDPLHIEKWTQNQTGKDFERFMKFRDEIMVGDEVIINKDLALRYQDPKKPESYVKSGTKIKILTRPINKNYGVLAQHNLTNNDKFPYYFACKVDGSQFGLFIEFSSIEFHIKNS